MKKSNYKELKVGDFILSAYSPASKITWPWNSLVLKINFYETQNAGTLRFLDPYGNFSELWFTAKYEFEIL